MVVDFSVIKSGFLDWVQGTFDHALLLGVEDSEAIDAASRQDTRVPPDSMLEQLRVALRVDSLNVKRVPFNVTAETFAKYLYDEARERLTFLVPNRKIQVDYVRVYEQLHPVASYAEYCEKARLCT
jgi:6-pyruvoyl-tetrahydropterin synthase